MSLTLVIGGTRSGKSAHAERLVADAADGGAVRYVATAASDDASMRDRIAAHAARRPVEWETVEAGDDLAAAILPGGTTLIDGLGAWIARVLHRGGTTAQITSSIDRVLKAVAGAGALRAVEGAGATTVIVVAEEAGQGLLPMDAVSRTWLDALGEAIQQLSAAADEVHYVVAGRAIRLGSDPPGGHSERETHRHGAFPAQSRDDPGDSERETQVPAPCGEDLGASERALPFRHHGDRDARPGDADHAVNVLAGGPPLWLRDALAHALATCAERYPGERAAKIATGERHGRAPDEVVPTNGAVEALWLLGPALKPRHAVCLHPAFTESEAALRAHGVNVSRVIRAPGEDFAVDPSAVPDDADLVIVGNPASPSGTLAPAAAIDALRRPGRLVVVDEAFMEMVPGEPESLAPAPHDDVIVIRSLTKILSIPGLRAGYALAPAPLAAALNAVKPPWSANALALAALEAAAVHPHELAALAERAAAERTDLDRRLRELPDLVKIWPSVTNFCLIEVADGPLVVEALRTERIAVRSAASFPGLNSGYVRVTARDPGANERLVAALARATSARSCSG